MTAFGNYSYYYDLLYRDKDYVAESNYIDNLIQRFAYASGDILDLGCGTARHAILLAHKGYKIEGVEISTSMIDVARENIVSANLHLSVHLGDVRTIRLRKKFNVVVSLFHVMSYQTGNNDLLSAFRTAYQHLNPGGLFIFDCWYGPAAITDKPKIRIKNVEDSNIQITRRADPVFKPTLNVVEVNFTMVVTEKTTGRMEEIHETHPMRYLFTPEIDILLAQAGFELIHSEEWLTGKKPDFDTFSVCFIAKKK